jgi:hypothetical protein
MPFTPVPPIPDTGGVSEWQNRTLKPLVQNVELLCGLRNERGSESKAILRTDLSSLNYISTQSLVTPTKIVTPASGGYFNSSGYNIVTYDSSAVTLLASANGIARYSDASMLLSELVNLRAAVIAIVAALRK